MPSLYNGQDPFSSPPPTDEQAYLIDRVAVRLDSLHGALLDFVPESAERTLAIRKLEECAMWANKAIVFAEEPK